jgi:phage terminase Nu1 subunit (DNA packaging protein)
MTTWSNKQLATTLNLTVQRVGQLVKTGVLPRPLQGKHDPFTAVPAYITFISQRLAGGDLKGARTAKYAVETALRELELKQKSGEVIDRSAVDNEFFRIARTVRDNFQNLPARTAGLVAAERNQQRCYDILATEVQQILEGLTRDA